MKNRVIEWRIYPTADLAYKHSDPYAFYTLSTDICYGGENSCKSCYFYYVDRCLRDFVHLFELPKDGYISITPESHPELFI